jgi:hypothetical protein
VLESLTPDSFAPHVGETFRLTQLEPAPELRLDHIVTHGDTGAGRVSFSLFFVGPPEVVQPQSIYHLESEMGPLDIFLVPIAADGDGVTYEAVFA